MTVNERWRAAARTARVLAVALAAQLAAGAAWASEGGGHGDPWRDLLWKAINFIVLVSLLVYFGRKPLAGMLRGAAQAAKDALAAPRERARQAEGELATQRNRIDALQAELARMEGEARTEAGQEHDRLLAEARVQAGRIKATLRMQVEQEFSKARKELQEEVARQTIRLAEGLIAKRLDDPARQRIAARAIDQLGAGR